MTTNKYVYGKVTETHLFQRNSENLEKKKIKRNKNKWSGQKRRNFKLKYVKCHWEEMTTSKINW